ncbi:MAG: hypothetical protein E6J72_16310 [Deltaproteobacteria bacterium]|nr:MAG: hypothetical protein E6J72_16310 [Deltaproteobacteria bacterium]
MRRWPVAAALIAVTLFLVVATQTRQGGWNDASRLAMVEAIAEHGHLWVDGTQMSRYTGDVARIDGKFYSDKPPALAFAAVPVYAAEKALGITFRGNLPRAYYWTTLLTIGVSTVAGLAVLAWFLPRIAPDPRWQAATILAVGLGTLNTAYSVTFSNHPPSATALLVAFLLLWHWRRFGGGLASITGSALAIGFAALTDHGAAFYMPAFLLYVARPDARPRGAANDTARSHGGADGASSEPRRAVAVLVFAVVSGAAVVAYAAYAIALSGSPLPLPLQPRLFDYPGSYFADRGHLAGSALPHASLGDFARYVAFCLFGYRGLFTLTPLALFIVWGVGRVAVSPTHPHRVEARLALVPTIVLVAYYLVTSSDPGGNAYGVRWFCLFIPMLYVFLADTYALLRRRFTRTLFWVAYALSIPLALVGAMDPWLDPTRWGTGFAWVIVLRAHGWL